MESVVALVSRGIGIGYGIDEHLAMYPDKQFAKFNVEKLELPSLSLVVSYNQDSINKPTRAFYDGLCRFYKVSE